MIRELLKIDSKKATTGNSIPSKTLKLSAGRSAEILQNLFNDVTLIFLLTPVFKKAPFNKAKL